MEGYAIFTMGRVNVAIMSVFSNLINYLSEISIEIYLSDFVDTERPILKLIWKNTKSRIGKNIFKNKAGGLTLSFDIKPQQSRGCGSSETIDKLMENRGLEISLGNTSIDL